MCAEHLQHVEIAAISGLFYALRFYLPIWADVAAKSTVGTAILKFVARWWIMAQNVSSGAVNTSSPEYALFFGVTLFGIAAAPPLLYALLRAVRRFLGAP
jgi:hypothetical protein